MKRSTGVYVLEEGYMALLARAWLSARAERSIDIQYFIFASDNVGKIASDYLLRAAERGVKVRIIVDDLLVDAALDDLLALSAHPNLEIRIYNPNINLGKTMGTKLKAAVSDFAGINQRMHNKAFIVDGEVAVTGGRNVADEYFDFDHAYNFRDRDVLLLGGAVKSVVSSFEEYWSHSLVVPIERVTDEKVTAVEAKSAWSWLHRYACHPSNFRPEVRAAVGSLPDIFSEVLSSERFAWVDDLKFVADRPGKYEAGPDGIPTIPESTATLIGLLARAQRSILIQTPYLVTTKLGRGLLADAVRRGVRVSILTNSLGSTDNLPAFAGYARDREALLATGASIYEWKPDAAVSLEIMKRFVSRADRAAPIFALHAKTMVVDDEVLVVGTFNFDPRSAHLNTECLVLISSEKLASTVGKQMRVETSEPNAWRVKRDWNPDIEAGPIKRLQAYMHRVVPRSLL